jgi:hypothetical protein
MTQRATLLASVLSLAAIALAAACSGRTPLPGGAAPEYEPPRDYQPKRNVDDVAKGGDDDLGFSLDDPDGPPPPPPAATAPAATAPAAGSGGGPAEAATGGSAAGSAAPADNVPTP